MTAYGGRLEAQIYLSANWEATFTDSSGAQTVTINAGTWYLAELVAEINSDLIRNWTVTVADGEGESGLVTIDTSDRPFSVTWTSTSLRDLLGFTGDISNVSAAQTGTNACQGLWIPTVPKWSKHGDGDTADYVAAARQSVSPTGAVHTLVGRQRRVAGPFRWTGINHERAKIKYESVTNQSFERFWRTTFLGGVVSYFRVGSPWRFYWNAGDDSSYITGTPIMPGRFDPPTTFANFVGKYNIEIPQMELGAA